MRLWIGAIAALTASVVGAWAADDVISQRKALMKANGDATKAVVGMLKGAPFDLAAAQSALGRYADAAAKMPSLFPPDSKTGDTNALPAVWENTADFDARFAKLGADAKAAMASITDEASFKTTMPVVLKNCGGCHETYRAKTN